MNPVTLRTSKTEFRIKLNLEVGRAHTFKHRWSCEYH